MEYHDPAAMVRRLWSVVRLGALQDIVNQTIGELHKLEPSRLLGRELSSLDCEGPQNPIEEALKACGEELRNESGMLDSEDRRAGHCKLVREYKAQHPEGWGATFEEALDKYRRAASAALQASLDAPGKQAR